MLPRDANLSHGAIDCKPEIVLNPRYDPMSASFENRVNRKWDETIG
jgi:hypothetical protein